MLGWQNPEICAEPGRGSAPKNSFTEACENQPDPLPSAPHAAAYLFNSHACQADLRHVPRRPGDSPVLLRGGCPLWRVRCKVRPAPRSGPLSRRRTTLVTSGDCSRPVLPPEPRSKHSKGAAGHDRLPFSTGTLPSCDICQVAGALVFCKDDRALVCRRCDIAIHSATALAQKHERFFLLGGARVGLQTLPDPAAADPSEVAPLAKRTRAQHKATNQNAQPTCSSDEDLQLVPDLDDAFTNLDVNSWVFSQVSLPQPRSRPEAGARQNPKGRGTQQPLAGPPPWRVGVGGL